MLRGARRLAWWVALALLAALGAACEASSQTLQITEIARTGEGTFTAVWECGERCDEETPFALELRTGDVEEEVAPLETMSSAIAGDRLTLMFVVDASGDAGPLARATRGAVVDVAGRLGPVGASVGLVRASTQASLLAAPTDDPQELARAAEGLYVRDGWHALYAGVRLANEAMGGSTAGVVEPIARADAAAACAAAESHAIVAVVGGPDSNSWGQNHAVDHAPTYLADLEQMVVGAGRPALHVIAVDTVGDGLEDLSQLARATGGTAVSVASADEVADAIEARVEALLQRTRRCVSFQAAACPRFEVNASVDGDRSAPLVVTCP